jgi:hypothetical protein
VVSPFYSQFSVFDSNKLLRNELIGSFQFDASTVYLNNDHEFYRQVRERGRRLFVFGWACGACAGEPLCILFPSIVRMLMQWVALVDDLDEKDEGIQGYLRLSVAVVGPGDKLKVP